MSACDLLVKFKTGSILTPNEMRKMLNMDCGIIPIGKDVEITRINRQTQLDELREILDVLMDQYSVDIFLKEDPSSFNTYAVFIRGRDLCNKVGVRILFTYDEIFYGSHEDVIRKIISAIIKMKEPIEKPTPVKVCTDNLAPRLCKCCNAPLPAKSNTCEYCGVSYGAPSTHSVDLYDNLGQYITTLHK